MLGNGRLRNVEAGRELGNAHFALRETLEHGATRGIRQRTEDFRLNHRDINISRYLYVLQQPPEKIARLARLPYYLLPEDLERRRPALSSSLNVQLTDALRKYVDERASDKDVYATPSEYIRDLIRQDMQDRAVALNILEGLADLRHGRFSDKSILDFKDED
jgi:antitoxin ParD1/3/4